MVRRGWNDRRLRGRMMESQTERNELSRAEVANQLRALGVKKSGVLLLHTSFRATRPVEGGPLGLIDALRDALGPAGHLGDAIVVGQ